MNREQWLEERKSGIGGSDVAGIMGLSPWATPVSVWLDKTGRAAPKEETEAMRIGTELESFVARRYEQETGRTVHRYNTMIHDGCLLGNLDRLVVKEGEKVASYRQEIRTDTLLECKTASREWDGEVPLYYQTQVQHYMGLCPALKFADVAVLFLGRKHFEIFRVERDQAVIEHMQQYCREWWEKYVVGDKQPPPTNEADCKLLWSRSNPGKSITSTAELDQHLAEYRAAQAAKKAAEAAMASARNAICTAMGDAEILRSSDGRPLATWSSAKDSETTNWEAVARQCGASPEIVAAHTTTVAGSRRFILKTK